MHFMFTICRFRSFAPLLRTNPCNKAPMDFCILRIGTSNTSDLVSMYIIYLNVTLSIVNCLTIPSDYGASFCASSAKVILLLIFSATSAVNISSSVLCNGLIISAFFLNKHNTLSFFNIKLVQNRQRQYRCG